MVQCEELPDEKDGVQQFDQLIKYVRKKYLKMLKVECSRTSRQYEFSKVDEQV